MTPNLNVLKQKFPKAVTPNLNVLKQKFPKHTEIKPRIPVSLKKKNLWLGGITVPQISENDISKHHIDMVPKDSHHVSLWLPRYNKQEGRRMSISWYGWPCFNLMAHHLLWMLLLEWLTLRDTIYRSEQRLVMPMFTHLISLSARLWKNKLECTMTIEDGEYSDAKANTRHYLFSWFHLHHSSSLLAHAQLSVKGSIVTVHPTATAGW